MKLTLLALVATIVVDGPIAKTASSVSPDSAAVLSADSLDSESLKIVLAVQERLRPTQSRWSDCRMPALTASPRDGAILGARCSPNDGPLLHTPPLASRSSLVVTPDSLLDGRKTQ